MKSKQQDLTGFQNLSGLKNKVNKTSEIEYEIVAPFVLYPSPYRGQGGYFADTSPKWWKPHLADFPADGRTVYLQSLAKKPPHLGRLEGWGFEFCEIGQIPASSAGKSALDFFRWLHFFQQFHKLIGRNGDLT